VGAWGRPGEPRRTDRQVVTWTGPAVDHESAD